MNVSSAEAESVSQTVGHPSGALRPPLTFGDLVMANYESKGGDSGKFPA